MRLRNRRGLLLVIVAAVVLAAGGAVGILASSSSTSARRVQRSTAGLPSATTTTTSAVRGPPFAVSVIHLSLSRTDPNGDVRLLPVTVRYPTSGPASAADASEAPSADGPFSLVLFAHGWNGSADFYATMEHEIAAAGFIVAAPNFPHTSSTSATLNRSDVVNQPADLTFLIDQFTTTPPPALVGHIAPTKVGVVGHSDGGVTAAGLAFNSCCADRRVGAAAILSGAELFFGGSWFPPGSPPLLAVHGTSDEVNPFGASQRLFADAPSPKYLVSVPGGHIPPYTTDPVVRPAVSALVADFLLAELVDDAQAHQRLPTDAMIGGLQLVASG